MSKLAVAIGISMVAIGLLVVVNLLAARGVNVAKVGPFSTTGTAVAKISPSSSAGPTAASGGGGQRAGIKKPGDAKQAVLDAVGRTADFKDVKYTRTFTYKSATVAIDTTAQVSATKSPVMIDTKSTTSAGKKSESILNGANNTLCLPDWGPAPRLTFQTVAADAADPFSDLVKTGTNWKFLDNVDLNGHQARHVIGETTQTAGDPNAKNRVDVSTSDVWIDLRSGKIEKRIDHTSGSENGSKYDRTSTDTDFVYNSGVTITPCK